MSFCGRFRDIIKTTEIVVVAVQLIQDEQVIVLRRVGIGIVPRCNTIPQILLRRVLGTRVKKNDQ